MPALLRWILRLVGIAMVARRAMRGGRRTERPTPEPGRAGSLRLPELPIDLGGAAREARAVLRETFWSLAGREILVLLVSALVVGGTIAVVVASTR